MADENMPFAAEGFSRLGEVRLVPGRELGPADIEDCDILAIRSVTRVDENLLGRSRVRFVGTATIGVDHVDTEYLTRRGVGFASASGCNAVSVAEYLVAAFFVLADRLDLRLADKSIGVIGAGNVGSRVAVRAEALGMRVILNDPPLKDKTGDLCYRPLEEAVAADIVTLHVPLDRGGPYPTWQMVDSRFIDSLKPGAILINTSRGSVVDTAALEAGLESGKVAASVLDVWENEPRISLHALRSAQVATPHIAGYSFDGKARGTWMVYRAACRYFGLEPDWDPGALLPAPVPERLRPGAESSARDTQAALGELVAASYDILADDSRLRAIENVPETERGKYFDRLRREYPVRREFFSRTVELAPGRSGLGPVLEGLGFKVEVN
ncbi:MAG: 4-phosphoerythronate dehydrogenase [Gemmatimonadota bacterium]|nr:4-phosphoerythronate dehydrogenase [Gemmatimonadota bacterium]